MQWCRCAQFVEQFQLEELWRLDPPCSRNHNADVAWSPRVSPVQPRFALFVAFQVYSLSNESRVHSMKGLLHTWSNPARSTVNPCKTTQAHPSGFVTFIKLLCTVEMVLKQLRARHIWLGNMYETNEAFQQTNTSNTWYQPCLGLRIFKWAVVQFDNLTSSEF